MTKLDLSALKKQNVSNVGQSSSESQGGYISPVSQQPTAPATSTAISAATSAPQKLNESSKPKLSLSSFKKGGGSPVSQQPTAPATSTAISAATSAPQKLNESSKPKLSLSSITGKSTSNDLVNHPQTSSSAKEEMQSVEIDSVSSRVSTLEKEVVAEPSFETISPSDILPSVAPPVGVISSGIADVSSEKHEWVLLPEKAKEAESEASEVKKEIKREKTSSEFFPNLSLQNDDLFGDMVEMGIVPTEAKVAEMPLETIDSVIEDEQLPHDQSTAEPVEPKLIIESDRVMDIEVDQAIVPKVVVEAPVDDAIFVPEGDVTKEVHPLVSIPAEVVVDLKEDMSLVSLSKETTFSLWARERSNYVKKIAEHLSRLRKGGLAEFAVKRKKALLGVAGLSVFSLSILGTLFGFGVFELSKSNIAEAPTSAQSDLIIKSSELPIHSATPLSGSTNKTESGSVSHKDITPTAPLIRTPNIRKNG